MFEISAVSFDNAATLLGKPIHHRGFTEPMLTAARRGQQSAAAPPAANY